MSKYLTKLLHLTNLQYAHLNVRTPLECIETFMYCDSAQIAALAPSNATNELSPCNRDSALMLSTACFLDSDCDCLTRG